MSTQRRRIKVAETTDGRPIHIAEGSYDRHGSWAESAEIGFRENDLLVGPVMYFPST